MNEDTTGDDPRVEEARDLARRELPRRPIPPRTSAAGVVVGNAMIGMYRAIYGPPDEVTIVVDGDSGGPDPDADVDLGDDPTSARVTFRHRPD